MIMFILNFLGLIGIYMWIGDHPELLPSMGMSNDAAKIALIIAIGGHALLAVLIFSGWVLGDIEVQE